MLYTVLMRMLDLKTVTKIVFTKFMVRNGMDGNLMGGGSHKKIPTRPTPRWTFQRDG